MAKRKKGKNIEDESVRLQKAANSFAGVQIQMVNAKKTVSVKETRNCSCYRKGYCTMRDDICKPYSLKCIKNRKSFMPATFSGVYSGETESARKLYRGSNTYDPYVSERYGSNEEIRYINLGEEILTLYVFKGFLNISPKNTIDYYVKIADIGTGKMHKILVAYNMRNNRYYISETYLKYLHKRKIYLNAIIYACNEGSIPLITPDFNDISRLAMYGYSVGRNGLSTDERRKILRHVIDNKIMRKYEIVEHLQGLISLREKREDADFSVAISNWQSDIIYINGNSDGMTMFTWRF